MLEPTRVQWQPGEVLIPLDLTMVQGDGRIPEPYKSRILFPDGQAFDLHSPMPNYLRRLLIWIFCGIHYVELSPLGRYSDGSWREA